MIREAMVKKDIEDAIDYSLLLLLLLGIIAPGEITIIYSLVLLMWNIFKYKRIIINSNLSLWTFFIIWILGIGSGIFINQEYNIYIYIRYTFYLVSPVIYCYYGFILNKNSSLNQYLRTFYLAASLNIVYFFVSYIYNIITMGIDFRSVRETRETVTIMVVLAVFIYLLKDREKNIFNKRLDNIIFIASLITVIVCLTRFYILVLVIGLIIYLLTYRKVGGIIKITRLTALPLIIIAIVLYTNDNLRSLANDYLGMILRSVTEISTENIWNTKNITKNWRGFEVYMAQQQFLDSNVLQKILGFGAKGVFVGNISRLVAKSTIGGFLPRLHNGYYAILTYSGIIGLVLYIYFYLGKILFALKYFRYHKDPASILLIIIIAASMAGTYLMTGPISSGGFLYLTMSIGFLMSYLGDLNKK